MYLKLRVLFTILSAICVAAVVPMGAFFDWIWAALCAIAAFLFYVLMRICKVNQEMRESQPTHGDFLAPKKEEMPVDTSTDSDEKSQKE
ncbi:MAG: hypothetical protein IJX91_03805 [Clostridia bacterium]|nr:hypothetical protein [Clostridia bacterium]